MPALLPCWALLELESGIHLADSLLKYLGREDNSLTEENILSTDKTDHLLKLPHSKSTASQGD